MTPRQISIIRAALQYFQSDIINGEVLKASLDDVNDFVVSVDEIDDLLDHHLHRNP